VGIVTDHDIRERVVAPGVDLHAPVYKIMSAPIATIPDKSPIFDALLLMEEKDIQHLAVADETGGIVSVVHKKDLVQFHRYGSVTLVREIARAGTAGEVVRCCRRTHDLVRALLGCGAHPHSITRTIASICDAATERLAALAESELGAPPAPYVVLALGSQGRQEQTLFTDQDNAILYELPDGQPEDPGCTGYFVEMGKRLCGHLDQAGYPFCLGNVMAQNPKWVKPLAAWKGYFAEWLRRTEPQDLLELSIFFDFRAVHGEARLAHELRRCLHQELAGAQAFFPHFAQNALLFKPPYWLFGRILVTGAGGDQAGLLNLKDAMMPMVSFARLYALRHRVDETHTLDRVNALVLKNILSPENREEFASVYDSLMRLRLRRQVEAIRSGQPPDNIINPRKLTQVDEILLKQAFSRITAIQKRISYDFLGGTA
jgi:CBS domain-containing protein